MMAGYSGTPLSKKLGIKPGARVRVSRAPENYDDLLAPLPDDAVVSARFRLPVDILHIFVESRVELQAALERGLRQIQPDGAIWVSWPKKKSSVATDVTEDVVRDLALPMSLVDVKVCAVDDMWSGLKLVIRKDHRAHAGR